MKDNAESLRNILLQEIKNRLLPIFTEKGFTLFPLSSEEASSELKKAFPLGRLKRARAEELDIIEIQFDKKGKPKFVINFGIVPEGGVTLPWGEYLHQDKADVSALSNAYRLYSSSGRKRWFKPSFFSNNSKDTLKKLVDKSIELSVEIEEWFNSKVIGKHMIKFGL